MDSSGKDVTPTQSIRSDDGKNSTSGNIIRARTRSASMSVPTSDQDEHNTRTRNAALVLQMSGPLSPNSNNEFVFNPPQVQQATANATNSGPKIKKAVVQRWNKFFMISGFFGALLDPTFIFLLSVRQDNKCIMVNVNMTTTILLVIRTMIDVIFLLHMLLQFWWLHLLAPDARVKSAARRFFFACALIIDTYVALPLPQIFMLKRILPDSMGLKYTKDLLGGAINTQYVSRLWLMLALLRKDDSGLTIESELGYCVRFLLAFVFLGHAMGSAWYLFGIARFIDCFKDACGHSNITSCEKFINCGFGDDFKSFLADNSSWILWKNDKNATACSFGQGRFNLGIFEKTVNLATHASFTTRCVYSLLWGLQQLITAATNLAPSDDTSEVIFTLEILVGGVLLYFFSIPTIQKILQALGRRKLEMTLRRRDIEQWMRHHRLPEELRSHVRDAERFNWAATRGVKEEMLMENLPEDLQRDIRRHIFDQFIAKVPILQGLDESIVDAVFARLKTEKYIKESKILCPSRLIDKMVFIIRGEMESTGEDGIAVPLGEGDVCGEELLTWCVEHSYINEDGKIIRIPGHRLLSKRLVRCLTNVEAYVLRAADLEEVATLFSTFLRRPPHVQGAVSYKLPYSRGRRASRRIQVSWRCLKKKIGHT